MSISNAARISLPDPNAAIGSLARLFSAQRELRGRIPNSALAWAHIPHVAKFRLPAALALQSEGLGGALSARIKEIAVLRTSYLNTCAY